MTKTTRSLVTGLTITAGVLVGACTVSRPGGGGVRIAPLDFDFNDGDGLVFDVQANQDSTAGVEGTFEIQGGFTIRSGTVEVPLSAIEVEPGVGGQGKAVTTLQPGEPLSVTVWVAPPGDADALCPNGDQYGPFTVTLDENFLPVSVDPAQVELTDATVALINSGELAICLRVNWTQDARVTVRRVTFEVR